MLCVGTTVYLYGGEGQQADDQGNVSTVAFKDLWKFDLLTETWTQLASGGQGGPDVAMTHDPVNHALVVFGHYDDATGHGGTDLWTYDLASDSWSNKTDTAIADGACPSAMRGHAGVYAPSVDAHVFHNGFALCAYRAGGVTTLASIDTTPLTISEVQVMDVTATTAIVKWTTNTAATGLVQYGLTTAYGSTSPIVAGGTSHSVTLTGLTAGTTYQYLGAGQGPAGNSAEGTNASFRTAGTGADTTPLTISEVQVTDVTATTATVTWTTNRWRRGWSSTGSRRRTGARVTLWRAGRATASR